MCTKKNKEYVNNKLLAENREVELYSEYTGMKSHSDFKCLKCNNIWLARPDSIIRGHGCPKCEYNSRRLTNEEIDRKILGSDTARNENFINSKIKIEWLCLRCNHKWKARVHKIFLGQGCPLCSTGRNERRIRVIIENNFSFSSISKKSYLINGVKRIPDFTITLKDSSVVIVEYNGEQHYKPTKFSNKISDEDALEKFIRQRKRDSEVNDYFTNRKIPLIWIKYDTPEENIMALLEPFIPKK